MTHDLVNWGLAVISVAAIVVTGFGVLFLTRGDSRISALEEKAEHNQADIAHIEGFLAGISSYRSRT